MVILLWFGFECAPQLFLHLVVMDNDFCFLFFFKYLYLCINNNDKILGIKNHVSFQITKIHGNLRIL